MNPRALRITLSKLVVALATAASALILGSCGGGGAGASNTGSAMAILPSAGTFYAGIPYDFTVAGGVVPYLVSSTEPDLFPVPRELSGHTFTVIPNNPAVVDAGLTAGALQGRTVVIEARDKNGAIVRTPSSQGIFVARNFMTGYGVFYSSTCPAPAGGGAAASACPGGDTIITAVAVTNGGLFSNRQYRFEVISGDFVFVQCDPTAPVQGPQVSSSTITCRTDHEGKANVRARVAGNAGNQLASFRMIDVASGVSVTHLLRITAGAMTLIPNELTLTGPALSATCGRGPGYSLILNGKPPYSAFSSNPNFTTGFINDQLAVTGSGACEEATIVVRDSSGASATLEVEAVASPQTPPALTVSPTTVNLASSCGFTGSTTFIGGGGNVSVSSNHPRVTAGAFGNTISVTRALSDAAATPPFPFAYPTTATISVTDGTVIVTITVSGIIASCP